jgi:hypothetical protein
MASSAISPKGTIIKGSNDAISSLSSADDSDKEQPISPSRES